MKLTRIVSHIGISSSELADEPTAKVVESSHNQTYHRRAIYDDFLQTLKNETPRSNLMGRIKQIMNFIK